MKALLKTTLCCLVLALCAACSDDDDTASGLLPTIAWDVESGRYQSYTGEALTIVPTIGNEDETTTYQWVMDGEVIGTASAYTFLTDEVGTYYIQFTVTNRYGSAEDEIRVTVTEGSSGTDYYITENDTAFSWRFPWEEINMAQGRTIKVKAYFIENAGDATYQWTLDGTQVEGLDTEVAYVFTASEQGGHELTLTMQNDTCQRTQIFRINVCPPEGTYQRAQNGDTLVSQVFDYQPAPGHQVNGYTIIGQSFPDNCTLEQALDTVMAKFQRRQMVSLGAQGGYVTAGFDHSVPATAEGAEIIIKGNPYNYQSEPGIVWVSQDDNGDGLPNDQWFELAGSEYSTDNHHTEYAIIYYKPTVAKSYVRWRDSDGVQDSVPYLGIWNPSDYYWQPWVEGTEQTLFGSRLVSHHTYTNGVSDMPPYDWGYADNLGEDLYVSDYSCGEKMIHLDIANARTWDGKAANLQYVDFVRVQTGQYGSTPNLGDISTEIHCIRCKN